jgi:predicted nucleotidyltransferase component of viral defense system
LTRQIRDLTASVRQRLLNLAKSRGEEFQATLTRYALERLLYRLSLSSYRDVFLLKGAMLFSAWTGVPHRPTWDVDFLGRGEPDIARLEAVFSEIGQVEVEDDGLEFDAAVRGERIREDQRYGGIRLHTRARLGNARISLQIDVGFGDAVTPHPTDIDFPTLLDQPAPRLRAYPRETVVAEKLEILISLGMGNSRAKDFYDLVSLARDFEFEGRPLVKAISATFKRRGTPLPAGEPIALTDEFSGDGSKQAQWRAFLKKSRLVAGTPPPLGDIIVELRAFLLPPLAAAAAGEPLAMLWPAGGPWHSES